MSRYWSDFVNGLEPYIPGEQPSDPAVIKLNTNENPYGPSPKSLKAITDCANQQLRLYPCPESKELKNTIADYYDLSPDQIFVGNGSDEVLAHAFNGLFRKTQPVLFPDITYSFYPVFCRLYDISYHQIPLAENFYLQLEQYCRPNGGIIFPNPNAPTGRFLDLDNIENLLREITNSVVVVDEAYIDFGGASCAALIPNYDNLLVVHTLSKSRSLAGLRIGYAMGSRSLINGLNRVKNSFNSYPLSRIQASAAVASFKDKTYFKTTIKKVIVSRQDLTRELEILGFEVVPSMANFLLVTHPKVSANSLYERLRANDILVRHFDRPRIDSYIRITVGNDTQNRALTEFLRSIVKSV